MDTPHGALEDVTPWLNMAIVGISMVYSGVHHLGDVPTQAAKPWSDRGITYSNYILNLSYSLINQTEHQVDIFS